MRLERADVRPEMANWRSERADLRPERTDLRPQRADLRPARANLRLEEWVELGHEKPPNESKSCTLRCIKIRTHDNTASGAEII